MLCKIAFLAPGHQQHVAAGQYQPQAKQQAAAIVLARYDRQEEQGEEGGDRRPEQAVIGDLIQVHQLRI